MTETLMTADELLRLDLGSVALRVGSRIAVYVDDHDLGRALDGEDVLPGFSCALSKML